MNRLFKILSFFAVFVLGVLLLTKFVGATNYPQGSLVKTETGNSVYYVSSDGRKFPFPDALTYKTWYSDFKNIKKISDSELNNITNGNRFVTVRPGTKLIAFKGSKGVYALYQGAILRKIKKVEDARVLFGVEWYKQVVVLPSNLVNSYLISGNVENTDDYSAIKQRNSIISINDSLIERGIVGLPGKIFEDPNANLSRLKLIQENFSDSLSPRFNSFVRAYSLRAHYNEKILGLKPLGYSEGTVIKINGLIVSSGAEQGIRLQDGTNIIKIEVIDPGKEIVTYTISVYKESADTSSRLSDMEENLVSHNFEPEFRSNRYDYSLKADYGENSFKMRFKTFSKYTRIFVNGREYDTSNNGYTFALDYGENKFRIYVVAQDGTSNTYNLTANRSPYKNLKEASLSSLTTNLKNGLTPVFNMNETNYKVYARENETTAQFRVISVNSNAIVSIDEQIRNYINYPMGYRTVKIRVLSPDGLERTYKVKVYPFGS